ncbi:MAG: DUF1570 domain-containing protein [Thermoguttaceae bacterium]
MPTHLPTFCTSLLLAIALAMNCCAALPAASVVLSDEMVEGLVQGKRIEGVLLGVSHRPLALLGRDGHLWLLQANEASRFDRSASRFHPYPPSEFRAALLRELGDKYEVTGTTHYLIAHPRGQQSRWAERFEELYRSFIQYFSVRGFEPATPPFPLAGIVCGSRGEFDRLAAVQVGVSPGVQGYYNPTSNRITMYDMTGNRNSANWRWNAAVLIHEATHQMAFNTGIHNRYAPTPTWVAEGLATLFEAPGVCDSRNHAQIADRVNRLRLRAFRQVVAPRHRPELLAKMVAGDDLFHSDVQTAYAEAWALSFYLTETQPRQYGQYLKRTGSRPPFRQYTAAERTADFTALFGDNWRMLEAQFLRFMAGVK